jgi:hypothetical protein
MRPSRAQASGVLPKKKRFSNLRPGHLTLRLSFRRGAEVHNSAPHFFNRRDILFLHDFRDSINFVATN